MVSTLLFIDADNQSPVIARKIVSFLKTIGRTPEKSFIAGNGSGDCVRKWDAALREADPRINNYCHVAQVRKQSADALLLFEIGAFYHEEPNSENLFIICSRDDLLIASAEHLASKNHNAMVIIGASANTMPVNAAVPVVIVAPSGQDATKPTEFSVSAPSGSVHQQTLSEPQATLPKNPKNTLQVDIKEPKENASPNPVSIRKLSSKTIEDAIRAIRDQARGDEKKGYCPSAVGHVLGKIGYNKKEREIIIKRIPNLKKVGSGHAIRLFF